jgi:hypothetical protein
MRKRHLLTIASLCATAGLVAACPGELENPERFLTGVGGGGPCPDIPQLFRDTCTSVGCHNASEMAEDLDLESPGVEDRVAGVPGTSTCNGIILADPDNPPSSLLVRKLQPAPPCGSQMPLLVPKDQLYTAHQIACVEAWIATLEPSATTTTTTTGGGGGMGGAGGANAGGAGGG